MGLTPEWALDWKWRIWTVAQHAAVPPRTEAWQGAALGRVLAEAGWSGRDQKIAMLRAGARGANNIS